MFSLRKGFLSILLVAFFAAVPLIWAQQKDVKANDPIAKLLDLPALLPETVYEYADPWERKDKPVPIPDENSPIELLAKYWRRQLLNLAAPKPSEKVRQRLLGYVENNPDELPGLRHFLPDVPATHDLIKALFDQRPPVDTKSTDYTAKYWHDSVREWLMTHSRYLRDELDVEAAQLREASGYVQNEQMLYALARLDWARARPILETHAAANSQRRVALALILLYAHAVEAGKIGQATEFRERLLAIAADRKALGYARAKAIEALLKSEWLGRDDWYLALFNDESLRSLRDGNYPFQPLSLGLNLDEKKWFPVVTSLIGHPNRVVHDGAVNALLTYNTFNQAKRETVLPLLPWLTDANWTSGASFEREQLLRLLRHVSVPEAVPGLIALIEKEPPHQTMFAAEALANYHAPQAGPALRRAAEKSVGMVLYAFTDAIVKCGALTDEERLAALMKYAAHVEHVNPSGLLDYALVGGDFNSAEWSIGSSLSKSEQAPLHLVPTLLGHSKALEQSDPKLARNLWLVIQRWPSPLVYQTILERLADGTADDLTIRQALLRRKELQSGLGSALARLFYLEGRAAGIAAVLSGDTTNQQSILQSKDIEAQIALLACARLLREALPIEMVSVLYQKQNARLSQAVDHYLESEDSVAARHKLWARHPGEAVILGAPYHGSGGDDLSKWEDQLRADLRTGKAEEVFAMVVLGYRDLHSNAVIRVVGGNVTVTRQRDKASDEYRELTNDEVREFRALLQTTNFDELPAKHWVLPANSHGSMMNTRFVHITQAGGRRVMTNTVGEHSKGQTPYDLLFRFFDRLTKTGEFKLRYFLAERIPGLEVLYAAEAPALKYVCGQDKEIFVLPAGQFKEVGPDSTWHKFLAGKLGSQTVEPAACPYLANEVSWRKKVTGPPDAAGPTWQLKVGNDVVRAGSAISPETHKNAQGVWRFNPDLVTEQIALGTYYRPLVTHDAKWIIVTKHVWKQETKQSEESVVRLDTKSYQEFPTKLRDSKEYLRAVVEIRELSKILVCRQNGYDPQTQWKGCWVLDPATGDAVEFKGEMRPLGQQTFRSLQSTAEAGKYWAAIPEQKEKRTLFGLYDARRFAFTTLLELPDVLFDSMQMWVDETDRQVYFVYEGHLLRLPLPKR